jgi:N-acetylglutamate synthase-like GNAT family acetyltransferase
MDSQKMTIRKATVNDADEISAILHTLSVKYIGSEFNQEGRTTLLGSIQAAEIRQNIRSDFRYHVAEIDGRILGVVGIRNNCHLYHLFVVEAYLRKGIARKL